MKATDMNILATAATYLYVLYDLCRLTNRTLTPIQIAKGRPEVLLRHLFEKCPHISEADRETALIQASDHGAFGGYKPSRPLKRSLHQTLISANGPRKRTRNSLDREPSALDTLAEVSRQQLGDSADQDQQWFDRLQQQLVQDVHQPPPPPRAATDPFSLAHAAAAAAAAAVTDSQVASGQTAPRAIGQRIANGDIHKPGSNVDPQLYTASELSSEPPEIVSLPAEDAPGSRAAQGQPISIAQPGAVHFRQTRHPFTHDRRQQVGEMRKLGACIRCRMLKKPCSEGMPCKACSLVAKARVWKHRISHLGDGDKPWTALCIRVKLMDELTMYETGFSKVRSAAMINEALVNKSLHEQPGSIEASLSSAADSVVSFKPMAAIQDVNNEDAQAPSAMMINFDADHVAIKLEMYLTSNTLPIISCEQSRAIKACLDTSLSLIAKYSDTLLAKVVNLWVASQILTQNPAYEWILAYSHESAPKVGSSTRAENGREITAASKDYEIIKTQLADATERYCAKLITTVLKQLDQRVVDRKQSPPFVTYMIAVILLNCVERMSLHFRRLDAQNPDFSSAGASDARPEQGHDVVREHTPSDFCRQGIGFAHILCDILRLRDIALRFHASFDIDGTLKVVPTTVTAGHEAQQAEATTWLADTGLTMHQLRTAKNIDQTVACQDHRAWDLSLLANLFWPVNGEADPTGTANPEVEQQEQMATH